jgi:hypothetical protein
MCCSSPKDFSRTMSSTFTSWPLPSLCFSKTNDTMDDETDWRVEAKTGASTCPCFALPFSKLIKLSMYESSGVLQIKIEPRCSHVFLCYSSSRYHRTRGCACMESTDVLQIKRKTQNVMFCCVVAQKSNQMPYGRFWSTANKTICTALHAFLCYFLKTCLSSFYGKVWCVGNTARRAHYVLHCCFSKSQRLSSMRSPAVLQLKSRTRKRNILLWSFSKHSWRSRYEKFRCVANKTYWHCSQRFALPFSSKNSPRQHMSSSSVHQKPLYKLYMCISPVPKKKSHNAIA